MSTSQQELVHFLDEYLDIGRFRDASLNGLQVQGTEQIDHVCLAVDACLKSILLAGQQGAQMLIVHHGLFWSSMPLVVGRFRDSLKELLIRDVNLYAAHLPLDAHAIVGNNAVLCRCLQIHETHPFGEQDLGRIGNLDSVLSLEDLADRVHQVTGQPVLLHGFGPKQILTVAVVSGNGTFLLEQAHKQGAQCLVTGEPRHPAYHEAEELGIHVIYAGHYLTEITGLKELGQVLEDRFSLKVNLLHLPTGL